MVTIKRLGKWMPMLIATSGFLLVGTSVAYAQSIADATKVADALVVASADNPLLAVIKIMAFVVLGEVAFSAWLVKIIIAQAETNSKTMSEFADSPCVLAHKNPKLFAHILEQCKP